ncbi:MAG: AAA family ATPase [Candidatus Woesebacteria bacterium]|nr:AAA family ATPase [Candidatus Woesebacteria bacterium]
MIIIGITGTLGAGKGTVVDYLVDKKGFYHYSVSGYLKEELQKQNREIDRTNMQDIANEIREKFGPDYITQKLFSIAESENHDAIIESIRNPKEADFIKSHGGKLFAVTALQKTRFERIKSRSSEKDSVSFKEFQKQEEREMQSTQSFAQNLSKCIEMADFIVNNDGSLKNLYEQIEKNI